MKTAIMLTALIMAVPLAGMAQPDDRQAGRDDVPPRQGWRGGDEESVRGPVGPQARGFRGEFGPGPRARQGGENQMGPRARQGAPDQMGPGAGPRRCPNCGWSPADGPPRGQGFGRGANLPPRQFRPGAGGAPAWGPRDGERPDRPAWGPGPRRNQEEPPLGGRRMQRGRPDRDTEED
jgi:hypothetical protein